ncbi:probable ribosome production factor 1 [Nilaparvata lugens]|uniref:probable ribosome production factor 1 n=1 Tax=Nilaparvata lugens TaxID=108931 RepID=UPI000B996AAB|nr:probable ribosome production factor 1 [Nilaparvata lugens]
MGKLRTPEDLKKINCPNHIKTKAIRQSINSKDRHTKKKLKKKERLKRRKAGEAPGIPRTLENTREKDETVLDTAETERVEEVEQDVATDEFQNYFEKSYEPKVLITFSDNPLKKTRVFGIELSRIIPNSLVRYRNRASVKKMIESAKRRNFSDIVIVNENMRQPNGLLLIHLPDGPTAHFRLSNVKITTELKKNHKNITEHRPEVIVNNFSTRLGLTIGRMLSSVFHYDPEFKGRRVVTFHNQRDYIFFRHHRYEFKDNAKPRLKELGPRFTLRLQSLQKGTFDSKCGEYEWIQTSRRHEIETSRRRFFL